MPYRCKNSRGEISMHDVPCAQITETIITQPAHVVMDWKAVEGHWLWILGLLAFSVWCLAIGSIGQRWLKSRTKKQAWQQAIAQAQQYE
ncbi:MAG: hypothetical protein ACH34Y_07525 [Brachymonas sp.]|jgi:hypothetical protein